MPGWTCDGCGRSFGRANQSHVCAPADALDDAFAERPADQRRACAAVIRHVRKLGPVAIEAVSVGVLIKRSRTFAELRPKRDCLALSVLLSDVPEHPRITRVIRTSAGRAAIFVELRRAADVDRTVRDWLAEGYFASPER